MRKKGKKKKIIALVLVLVLAGGAGGTFYYRRQSRAAEMPEQTVTAQTATAQLGTISNTIVGTGNLSLDEAEDIYVPSGIQIAEVMVESGDTVTKGQTLATIDEASVLSAVEEIQEEIQALDEKISAC